MLCVLWLMLVCLPVGSVAAGVWLPLVIAVPLLCLMPFSTVLR